MYKYINSETNQHVMKLMQLGADVQVISSKMVYVEFELEKNIKLAYVYNINKNNKYYLERIKPYPLAQNEFDSADEVILFIKIDYLQFKNAINSHNIDEFIKINKIIHKSISSFEDLFLNYNLPEDLLYEIEDSLDDIKNKIETARKSCSKVILQREKK